MSVDDSAVAAVDVDKMLFLVQNNPAIFNSTLKEHHNVDVISKIWTDIGKELNVPGNICKTKWHNLRNSYVRYLRDLKKMPSGSGQKKKKWHLADAMEFILPWAGPSRKMTGNLNKPVDPETPSPSTSTQESIYINDDLRDEDELNDEASGEIGNYNPKKKQRQTPAELVANPMAEYLKTVTQKHKIQEVKGENEFLSFFKSLIPDAEKLTSRRKRNFKTSVMTKLHQLLDEQEDEQASDRNINISSRAPSSSSYSGSNAPEVVEQYDGDYNYSHYEDQHSSQYQLHELLVLPKNNHV